MKSLEIVNKMVDYWESAFLIAETAYKTRPTNGWFDDLEVSNCKTKLEKYKQIKQDLEVLEILRKYSVLHFDDEFENQLEQRIFSGIDFEELDEEELYKVKQWLEENE